MAASEITLKWEYVLAIVIVVTAGVCVVFDKLSAENFIAIIGMVLSFLGGTYYGIRKGERRSKKASKPVSQRSRR